MTAEGTRLLPELATASATSRAKNSDRDDLLDAAVKAGKFSALRRGHYAAMYDRHPDGTRRLIHRLKAGAVRSERGAATTGLLSELG